ncbi:MAG: hypothetical protein OER80_13310 [Gammaproteobacteria bacterium]|nr:hypothetical protein [Gammaproteobacteria bacterium]
MTDYELISLFSEQISIFIDIMTMAMTILISYLAAMFFVSWRLPGILFWILNFLFGGLVVLVLSPGIYAAGVRAVSIGQQISARIETEGSEIAWLSLHPLPPGGPEVTASAFLLSAVLAVFFAVGWRRKIMREKASTG